MTIHVNIGEAKTRLSELIAASERGEEVVIARAGVPAVKLEPVSPVEDVVEQRRRAFGMWRGKISDEQIDALMEPMSDEDIVKARMNAFGAWKGRMDESIDWLAPAFSEQEWEEILAEEDDLYLPLGEALPEVGDDGEAPASYARRHLVDDRVARDERQSA